MTKKDRDETTHQKGAKLLTDETTQGGSSQEETIHGQNDYNVFPHRTLLSPPDKNEFKLKSVANKHCNDIVTKSNRKAMSRNWSNQKANPALKTKTGNK